MEWATLIGILLSVFGASYAAVSSLKSHLGERVDLWSTCIKTHIESIEGVKDGATDTNILGVRRHAKRFKFHHQCWMGAHWIPIFLFSLFMFTVCVLFSIALISGSAGKPVFEFVTLDDAGKSSPSLMSIRFGYGLLVFLLINLICFLTAISSYFIMKNKKFEASESHKAWESHQGALAMINKA